MLKRKVDFEKKRRKIENKVIFLIKERFGKKIRLTKERWHHIQERHPEVRPHLNKIKATLQNPDVIIRNRYNPDEKYYHKYFKSLDNYLIAIAQDKKKFVITAFISRKIKRGEILWRKI